MAESKYSAQSIQVLSGLEPVRRRPGMYTDTSRPNHLVQEVVDNSVDEALAGYAREIKVSLYEDGSVDVVDDGRGMPVDIHPEFKVSGVELILTRLHSGGKFDNNTYAFSGGLHGVGVSVVNALSTWLEVEVRRDGEVHHQRYESGAPVTKLKVIDSVGKRNTGTRVRFLPDPAYFDTTQIALGRLKHLLRAKAVLCPGLKVSLTVHRGDKADTDEWMYEDGLAGYLSQELGAAETVPAQPFCYGAQGNHEAVDWALVWISDGGELVTESYVNLIPTPLGGTHVNGLRSGLTEAMKEFCEFRDLLPRGLKLTGEDLWDQCSYVLVGEARRSAVFRADERAVVVATVGSVHFGRVERRVQHLVERTPAGRRQDRRDRDPQRAAAPAGREEGRTQEDHGGSRAAGQTRGLLGAGQQRAPSCSSSKAIPRVAPRNRRAIASFRR